MIFRPLRFLKVTQTCNQICGKFLPVTKILIMRSVQILIISSLNFWNGLLNFICSVTQIIIGMATQKKTDEEELIAVGLKSELQKLMRPDEPPKQAKPKEDKKISPLLKVKYATFFFSRQETRKMKRLVSYTNFEKDCAKSKQIGLIDLKFNVGLVGSAFAAIVIPKKIITKAFAGLLLMLANISVLQEIKFLLKLEHLANTDILNANSQQYRNILQFYANKRLEVEKTASYRKRLKDILAQTTRNTNQYLLYASKAKQLV